MECLLPFAGTGWDLVPYIAPAAAALGPNTPVVLTTFTKVLL
jgi:hypothetical protein